MALMKWTGAQAHSVRSVGLYCLITFGLAWSIEMAIIVAGGFTSAAAVLLYGLGWASPLLAAGLLTHREAGSEGVRRLLSQLLRWRPAPLYLVALAAPSCLMLMAVAAAGAPQPWVHAGFNLFALAPPLVEEPGWRGYLLPRLQRLCNPLMAAMAVGVLWSAWHVPTWFIPGAHAPLHLLPAYLLYVTAAGVVSAWLYNAAGRMLTIAIVFHVGLNLDLVPIPTGEWRPFTLVALLMAALAAAVALPLSRVPRSP